MKSLKDFHNPEHLYAKVFQKLGEEASVLIQKAYGISEEMHRGQKRLSGEPYIIHPLNVANILFDMGLDDKTIAAGLLHDIVEDTRYTRDDMVRDFGEEIAGLVEGVTKISEIKSQSKETEAAENIRKMLLATIKDIRVILIKLADKTHNLRTLKFQPPEKQKRIANETLSIYAPIAGRLGIYSIKFELEDLSFQALHSDKYQEIKRRVNSKKSEREEYIEKLKIILRQRLADIHIDAKIEGRAKHFYSIYRKMETKEKEFDEIFDLRALRIITDEIKDCYGVLGIVHTLWAPVPGRFKDYIATPKTNMYQSLHTTVIGPDGRPIEVQIRTKEMNQIAENGIAAHWAYKEIPKNPHNPGGSGYTASSPLSPAPQKEQFATNKWLEILKSWHDSTLDPNEFLEELKFDLHEDEVFVFSPKGEIIELSKGATVLDFAFRIHTDVGLHAKGARINGRLAPIRSELHSGDQVEVITDKKVKPSPIWLRIVKTASARQKLRQYFRRLQEESPNEPALIGVGLDLAQPSSALDKIEIQALQRPRKSTPSKSKTVAKETKVIVAGVKDILVRLASCCLPLPGDEIQGFITRGRGVSVHKVNCQNIAKQSEKMRLIPVRWDGVGEPIPVQIEVRARDIQGIYLTMVETISTTQTNIIEAGAVSYPPSKLTAKFRIEVDHLDQLKEILDNLRMIPDVLFADRAKKTN